MKYKLAFVMIFATLASCTKKQKNDLEKNNLFGDVQQITINRYGAETKFGDVVKGKLQQNVILTLNTSGNIEASDVTYYYGAADSSEVHNNKFSFQYDSEGHNVKTTSVKDPKNYTLKKYKGDLLVEEDDIDSGKLNSRTKYVYNSDNLASEINVYDGGGKFTRKRKLIYNDKGLASEIQSYKSTGELDFKFVVTYDDKGNSLTEKQTAGEYPFSTSYKYSNLDDKGNWLKLVGYNNGKPDTYTERIIKYR